MSKANETSSKLPEGGGEFVRILRAKTSPRKTGDVSQERQEGQEPQERQDKQDIQIDKTDNETQERQGNTTLCGVASRHHTDSDGAAKPLSAMTFPEYVAWAVEDAEDQYEASETPWVGILFYFVRAMAYFRDEPGQTPKSLFHDSGVELVKIAKRRRVDHRDPWASFFDKSRDEAEVEFISTLPKIRLPRGKSDPVEIAIERSATMTLGLRKQDEETRPTMYRKFISVAGWLQVTAGDKNIVLPCDLLGQRFNVSAMTISRMRTWAVEDGYIKLVKAHRYAAKSAAEYRFNVRWYRCLMEAAKRGTAYSFDLADAVPSEGVGDE